MERMFPSKKPSTMMNSLDRTMCVQGDSGLVLTTDPKPRLRWTVELHERFIDAVAQLGGPDKATPKTIMRVMGVKGLTLYHLKSHLQKFRLGKQPHKEFNEQSIKDVSAFELQRNTGTSSSMTGRNMNEMQMEVHRRLHEQLEVQKHLQLRIEAQGKYMQSILEKAYHTLAGENMAAAATNFKGINGTQSIPDMKDFVSPHNNFPHFQDLNICGSDEEQFERPTLEGFMPTNNNNENMFVGKKRTNPFDENGKSPLIWNNNNNDLRLHDFGTTSSCISPQDVPNFKSESLDGSDESDPIGEAYDTKVSEKKFGASMKLGITTPMINAVATGRTLSPFG
ncbi:myb family transcription factor IPN2-like isoform X2 [Vicia villosa]|uniref:myb family transcription factor IPN2-like isoform X2 n=1 Tax=Vicia villosa TaxID=3911 RepID=UPI00273BCC7B|nr:myb family transcription factor IPN2-like isoform X2 [Vicia villosa]